VKNLKPLENQLKVKFKNQTLLVRAMIHRSYLNENRDPKLYSNERLEYLGDAVLEFIVSEWLFEKFPHYPEGQLTNFRSNVVRTTALAGIAKKLKLGDYLMMSRGERESGGNHNQSLLANTLEAVIGAIYLDQGITVAKKFIKTNFDELIRQITRRGELKDTKSLLQEKTQAGKSLTPVYRTLKQVGPDHNKTFTIGVYLGKKILAKGKGKSKQLAEEAAAKKALEKIS
jgi:ribonuclease-3